MKAKELGDSPKDYCKEQLKKMNKILNKDFTLREWDEIINAVDDCKEIIDRIDGVDECE